MDNIKREEFEELVIEYGNTRSAIAVAGEWGESTEGLRREKKEYIESILATFDALTAENAAQAGTVADLHKCLAQSHKQRAEQAAEISRLRAEVKGMAQYEAERHNLK